MPNIKVERYYYPNGQLLGECSLEDGKPTGVTRKWHENGILSWECPIDCGLQHGVVRQWNKEGKMLGEYSMVHGTGIEKQWFENGQLERESSSVKGKNCGMFRCWYEDGELVSTSYYIMDKQVSKKKYNEACKIDSSLPRYEDNNDPKSKLELPSTKYLKRKAAASEKKRKQHDEFVARFLAEPNQAEARQWLAGNENRNVGEMAPEESCEAIEEGYKAGAIKIIAVEIQGQSTNCLIVELPKGTKRKRVFEWNNELAQNSGFDPDDDWGQNELFVFFD